VVFPAGVNYISPDKTITAGIDKPSPLYDYTKLAESIDWATYKGKIYAYNFEYPKVLTPLTFPNDSADSVTFKVSNTPPELNLMFLVETISSRDSSLVGKPEQFVNNYWKFYSGLKSVQTVTSFKNEKGLEGFKANYLAKSGVVTNDNYFFIIPGDSDHLLHIANIFGAEGDALFNRIVNGLSYKK